MARASLRVLRLLPWVARLMGAHRLGVTGPRARCHPLRKAMDAAGRCALCLPRVLTLEAVTLPPPPACPNCRAEEPGWRIGRDYAACVYCGQDWFRLLEVKG